MMHVLGCEHVREHLQAYHDGELPLDEQVRIQGHLRDCVGCAIEATELEELGEGLRAMSASLPDRDASDQSQLPATVLERLHVERQFSLGTRLAGLFDDMHFVWAALGATCALAVCLFGSMGVLHAASRERPDSLAGIISQMANPGSNDNPVRPDFWMLLPSARLDGPIPLGGEDGVVALTAVVTREGRVQNLELVEHGRTRPVKPDVLLALMNAASAARFQPAKAQGTTVAVNVVWLVATTTVKGQYDYDMLLLQPPHWPTSTARTAAPSPALPLTPAETPHESVVPAAKALSSGGADA
jgi:hypothetical protein